MSAHANPAKRAALKLRSNIRLVPPADLLDLRDGEVAVKIGKSRALRLAQRNLMSAKGFEHPYLWAPFVSIGDWRGVVW